MKFYDKENKRLIVFGKSATSEFWDEHWHGDDFVKKIEQGKNNRMVKKFTNKFLTQGSKVLEGGCGIGQNVYGLQKWGYDAFGVDFAEQTVNKTRQCFPNLKVSVQDVRKLDFADSFFDGYWSLGVIEHFFNGYDEILEEAKRVLKPGGYLFLTFPYMSPLRRLKAKFGRYNIFEDDYPINNFYEFIQAPPVVKKTVEGYGFRFISKYPFDFIKGLKDEISFLRPVLQKIYNSQNIVALGIRFLSSVLFARFAGHTILLLFQKNEN